MNRIPLEGSQAENLRTIRQEQTSILRRKCYDGFCIIAKEGSTLRNHSHPCSGRSVGIHADSSCKDSSHRVCKKLNLFAPSYRYLNVIQHAVITIVFRKASVSRIDSFFIQVLFIIAEGNVGCTVRWIIFLPCLHYAVHACEGSPQTCLILWKDRSRFYKFQWLFRGRIHYNSNPDGNIGAEIIYSVDKLLCQHQRFVHAFKHDTALMPFKIY